MLSSYTGPQPPSDLEQGQQWEATETSDFGCFLSGLAEIGYGVCYRILDAQFTRVQSHPYAVPQRRRRVFVVGYLGDWRPPAAVLIERESMCGHPAPRREAGKKAARSLRGRANSSHREDSDNFVAFGDVARSLSARMDGSPCVDRGPEVVAYQCQGTNVGEMGTLRGGNGNETGGVPFVSCSLNAHANRLDSETQTFVTGCFDERQVTSKANRGQCDGEVCGTQHSTPHAIAIQESATQPNVNAGPQGSGVRDDGSAFTLESRHRPQSVAPTLRSMPNQGSGRMADDAAMMNMVRRLTPVECERLQGFPDDWTLVPYRNGMAKDGPRYQAIGNSMAVNVMSWIGQRMKMVDDILKELKD